MTSRGKGVWTTVGLLSCALMSGCSSPRAEHDALLKEYQKIANRAASLVEAKSPTDPSVAAVVNKLMEEVNSLKHKKLRLSADPTPEQAKRYNALDSKFLKAYHAACPTCQPVRI